MLTNQAIEGLVSARRLKAFLDGDELQLDARDVRLNPNLVAGDVVCCEYGFTGTCLVTAPQVLEIKDGEFNWSKEAPTPTIEGINLVARKGELTGIVGRVGAGKVCLCDDFSFRLIIAIVVESPFGYYRRHAPA
jgi:ABC-type multidrug transport system fused ATPase/permease subunit